MIISWLIWIGVRSWKCLTLFAVHARRCRELWMKRTSTATAWLILLVGFVPVQALKGRWGKITDGSVKSVAWWYRTWCPTCPHPLMGRRTLGKDLSHKQPYPTSLLNGNLDFWDPVISLFLHLTELYVLDALTVCIQRVQWMTMTILTSIWWVISIS